MMTEVEHCLEPSMDSRISMTIAILCIVLAVVTISGNLLIIAAVYKDPLGVLRSNSNYLIVNLAVADLFVGLVGEPMVAIQYWCAWTEMIAYAPIYFGAEASCFAVVALTVERFIVIEFPLTYMQLLTPRRLKICIAITWIISTLLALLPFMGWHSTRQYRLFLFDVIGFIIFVILFGLYIRMFVVMRQYNRSLLDEEVIDGNVQNRQSLAAARAREQEVTKAIFLFFGLYTLCWAPSVVMENINYFECRPNDGPTTIQHVVKFVGLMNSALNPVLYGLRMRRFRRTVMKLCSCCPSADDAATDWRPEPLRGFDASTVH